MLWELTLADFDTDDMYEGLDKLYEYEEFPDDEESDNPNVISQESEDSEVSC